LAQTLVVSRLEQLVGDVGRMQGVGVAKSATLVLALTPKTLYFAQWPGPTRCWGKSRHTHTWRSKAQGRGFEGKIDVLSLKDVREEEAGRVVITVVADSTGVTGGASAVVSAAECAAGLGAKWRARALHVDKLYFV